jgi:streptogramin lyase
MKKITLILLIFSHFSNNAQIITTIAGNGTEGFAGDGKLATDANLWRPFGLAVDRTGNVYIADVENNKIRKINSNTGILTTIAGNGIQGYGGDGKQATLAKLNYPYGVTLDDSSNIYIAEFYNHRIRKVNAKTNIITTVAGNGKQGTQGSIGDGLPAIDAILYFPTSVAVSKSGDIYIADQGNHKIRKVDFGTGIISTIAGVAGNGEGYDGGLAINSPLNYPYGVALDSSNNVYIADRQNHRIRKINSKTGIITTVAGDGINGYGGDNNIATDANLSSPTCVNIDTKGNIYIADQNNHRIRKVNTNTGIITTIAGNGNATYGGDGANSVDANLNYPTGVSSDIYGNIYIADKNNNRVRKVSFGNVSIDQPKISYQTSIYPNPNNGDFFFHIMSPNASEIKLSIINMLGEEIWEDIKKITSGIQEIELNTNLATGVYTIKMQNEILHWQTRLIVR